MGYLEILETYHEEMKATLAESIAFPSKSGQIIRNAEGDVMPFGRDVHDAFQHMLNKGEELGFKTYNADNYGGHIEFSASEEVENPETLAVVGHLDVVPEGSGWSTDPFTLTEKDGYLFGRGVSDDKGPLVASLYAMKALKESGWKPKKNVRLVLGLDEETENKSIEYYINDVGHPDLGFTPDAEFPLINGEMGMLVFELAQKLTRQTTKDGLRLTKVEAGTAPNAVPGIAKAVIAADDNLYQLVKDRLAQYVLETGRDIKAKKQGSSLVIEATGVAAHGAMPYLGLNAISILMEFLGRLQFANEEINDFVAFYNDYLGYECHGERCGCALEDEPSGKLILNVGMASINEDVATLTVNIRYPVTCSDEQVYSGIEEVLNGTNIGIIKRSHYKPIFMDVDAPMAKKLMTAYREETGDNESQPMVIGGGTYAKMVNNILAFGALFPGEEDTMHQVNERVRVESYYKLARIIAKAIYLLGEE